MNTPRRILILAGEPSGDLHAAALMTALQARLGASIEFRGCGGDAMRAAGATLLYHTDQTAVMGLVEVLKQIRFFRGMMRRMLAELDAWRPDLVLTVDYPGFNTRFAAVAHDRGYPTVHMICPQVWAWHQSRIPKLARIFDHLLVFLPFEPACFAGTALPVTFVGHPLVDRAAETFAEPEAPLPWAGAAHRLALLPGSRRNEIARIFPDMLAAAARLDAELPGGCAYVVPTPSPAIRAYAEQVAAATPERPPRLAFVDGQTRQVLRQAHAAIVASGTATLEACLMRCPTVLVYRMHPFTAWVFRKLVTGTRHAGLANILAERCGISREAVMPELLQEAFTPERAAAAVRPYLTDPAARTRTLAAYDAVNRTLGPGRAAEHAAAVIDGILQHA